MSELISLTYIKNSKGPRIDPCGSTANKYYPSAGHHEEKNKKATGQIKFSAVTIKQ